MHVAYYPLVVDPFVIVYKYCFPLFVSSLCKWKLRLLRDRILQIKNVPFNDD